MSDRKVLFCGNLSENATEELLFELFLQAGPLESVKIPKDKPSGRNKNFAFVTFKHEDSAAYAIALFQGTCIHGKELQLDFRTGIGFIHNKYLEILNDYKAANSQEIFHSSNINNSMNDYLYQGYGPHSMGRMVSPGNMEMNLSTSGYFMPPGVLNNFHENRGRSMNVESSRDNRTRDSHRYSENRPYVSHDSDPSLRYDNRMKDSRRQSEYRQSPYGPPHSRSHKKSNEFSSHRRR